MEPTTVGSSNGEQSGGGERAVDLAAVAKDKDEVRERIWSVLEREGVARFPGARGRIPNFTGAEAAADRLAGLPEWRAARVLKINPDSPQLPVRVRALAEGKHVYMAVPRLTEDRPFLHLDPERLPVPPRKAASIKGAGRYAEPVALERLPHVDLVVCGTVAVGRQGTRIGKGGGYSDLEFALLAEAGRVDGRTAIATTVHGLQIVDLPLPETEHDFRVDITVTPDQVLASPARRRPPGVFWDHLDEEKIAAIPVLRRMRHARRSHDSGEV